MKSLIAFALLLSVPTAEIAAQEVNAAALASATSLSAATDDVQGTWELGLGYTFVHLPDYGQRRI